MIRVHPSDGEQIFHCGHKVDQYHWLAFTDPVTQLTPYHGKVSGQFVALCGPCHELLMGLQETTETAPSDLLALIRGIGVFHQEGTGDFREQESHD